VHTAAEAVRPSLMRVSVSRGQHPSLAKALKAHKQQHPLHQRKPNPTAAHQGVVDVLVLMRFATTLTGTHGTASSTVSYTPRTETSNSPRTGERCKCPVRHGDTRCATVRRFTHASTSTRLNTTSCIVNTTKQHKRRTLVSPRHTSTTSTMASPPKARS
jgi:hypothetical protein